MGETEPKLHAIMISFPLQGHIIPFVNLAMKVASKGIRVTFVHTEATHQRITQSHNNSGIEDIFAEARRGGLDILYTTIRDGLPPDFDRDPFFEKYWDGIRDIFPGHVDEFVGNLVKSNPFSTFFLIADTLYLWPWVIAKKYNLVSVSFWTEPALVFTLYYHWELLIQNGHLASNENRKDTIDYIPGVRAIKPKDLMSFFQDDNVNTWLHRCIFKAYEYVKGADFILCNTVQELESETISVLHQKQPFYAIGPIFPPDFTKRTIAMSLWSECNCTPWLNSKPSGSVLYVSFGSLALTSKDVILEIAYGLLQTQVNFIWVLRPGVVGSDDDDILPNGFEDDVKGRGVIVPWCNQSDVITHPAIGGFLTHCGWNSILESLWCGVPLLCYPLFADQMTNRKLVVDDWKIGMNLCKEKVVTRDEVSKNINLLMSGQTSDKLKKEIKMVRTTLHNALATNGSLEKNFNQFLGDLKVYIQGRNGMKST